MPKSWLNIFLLGFLTSGIAQELPQRQAAFLRALASELELQTHNDPGDAALWVRLAATLTELGELESAQSAYERARKLQPQDPEIPAALAYVRYLRGAHEAALFELNSVADKFPNSASVLLHKGLVEQLEGNPSAVKTLEKAQRLKSDDARINLALLRERVLRSPSTELEPVFQELLRQHPESYQARYEYGRLLLALGKPIPAVSVLHPLAEQYPDWVPGRVLLAKAYAESHDNISTTFELEHVPLDRLDADACLALGRAKEWLGHTEDAIRYLHLAIRLKPGFIAAERELANAYLGIGMQTQAGEILQSILARSPNDYDALSMEAYIWVSGGRYDRAIEVLRRLTQSDPSRWEAFEGLGYIALKRGDNTSVISYLQKVLELNPQDASACQWLGEAYAKLGKTDSAATYFRRAIALNPLRPEPHYVLGRILVESGHPNDGRKEIETAQALSKKLRTEVRGGMALAPALRP